MPSASIISVSSSSSDDAVGPLAAAVGDPMLREELLPCHPEETDLRSLSEDQLQQLSEAVPVYARCSIGTCRQKLQNLRGFVRVNDSKGFDMAKASRAINALRARIQLLLSVEQGTSRQQAVDQQQQQQLAPGGTGSSQAQQQLLQLIAAAQQLTAAADEQAAAAQARVAAAQAEANAAEQHAAAMRAHLQQLQQRLAAT